MPGSRRRAVAASALAVAAVAGIAAAVHEIPQLARAPITWYVSRHGNDGNARSWSSAWSQPSHIVWAFVRPGDSIVIDGGTKRCRSNYPLGVGTTTTVSASCGMHYSTALDVGASGTAGAPVTVRLSRAAGRNGTAVFFGGRSRALPYCDQQVYHPVGQVRAAGITIARRSHVILDGGHRSGFMIYGAQSGVDLATDSTSYVMLRNLEIFDNGTYSRWAFGYKTDGEGISLAGSHITIDRTLVHDNGQDAIQDRYTGVSVIEHAPLHDIRVTNSWLYGRRTHPLWPGYGFSAGAQDVTAQDCTHVDGLQIFGGGLRQQRMTFDHDVFGPFVAQGVYPGDTDRASFDNVVVSNSLFLNPLDHAIIGDPISSDRLTPAHWTISHVTSFLTPLPNVGLRTHGKVDVAGSGHVVRDSLFYNGYFAVDSSFAGGRGNVWWGGDPVPGGVHQRPAFTGPVPTTRAPSFGALMGLNVTPHCAACSGAGSPLHSVRDLLLRIDRLDRS